MHRLLRAVVVVCAVFVVFSPGLASAQGFGRGWFERWSGQGGFLGFDLSVTPICELAAKPDSSGEIAFLGAADRTTNTRWCLDLGFGFYENRDEDRARHGEVTFTLYQAVAMASPFDNGALELGAGAGIADFDGDNFEGFTRFYVPTRVAFKPFRVGRSSRSPGWTGIVQLVGNLHVFPKAITSDDTNFTDHFYAHHFQGNVILFFDFSSLIFRR
jgi:hypothetical protein